MSGDTTWLELQTLFLRAAALPRNGRTEVLNEAGASGSSRRHSLERLLAAHDTEDALLDRPADVTTPAPDESEDSLIGQRVGNYLITDVIGRGAAGAVYRAAQEHPRRWVAIKLPRFAYESPEMLQRLEFEAETLGRLQHPYIAQVIEAGAFERSKGRQPFIAMELIEGPSLTEMVRANNLSLRERVRLLMRVCEGVQHAHQRGVVHLDLKPANILVLGQPADPQPKILDFGIARWVDSNARESGTGSTAGILGTLTYMSPEQLEGTTGSTDIRCDLYSLGAIAFELLCGRPPIEFPPGINSIEAVHYARATARRWLRQVNPALPADLGAVISRAMHPLAAQRYSSAAELACDLQRFLQCEPVLARRQTPWYLLSRFVRRRRGLVGAALLLLISLIAGLVGLAWEARQEAQLRVAADKRLQDLLDTNAQMVEWVENGLADLPGSTALRLTLAESGLNSLLGLRAEMPKSHQSSEMLDYRLGYAHQRLGEVRMARGENDSALAAFEAALHARERLVEQNPVYYAYRRSLGVGHWKVADALLELGRVQEAQAHLVEALAIHESLRNSVGDPPVHDSVYLGLAHQRLALAAQRKGEHAAALAEFNDALTYFAAGLIVDPDNVQVLRGQARSLRGRAATPGTNRAEADLRHSLATCEHLVRVRGSAGVWERYQRAESLAALAQLSGDEAERSALRKEAHMIAAQLTAADPARADFADLAKRLGQ